MRTKRLGGLSRLPILLGGLLMTYSQPMAAPAHQKSGDEAAQLFAYDRSAPFDLREESSREQDGITVKDVSYAAYVPQRGRVKAYIIKPSGKGSFAGVVFFHWYGSPNGNRDQFVDEAVALAKQGVVSLLIQGYFPWSQPPTDGATDRRRVIDQTIEVRRALDLLLSQPGVDRKRLAYVGHDYGAMYGAIVAAVDKRIRAYVLVAGIGSFSDWSLKYWLEKTTDDGKKAYRQTMRAVDPITHIPRAKPAKLFFQFANSDKYITRAEATALYNAAGNPKEIKWYDAEHYLNVEAARKDRVEWLRGQLRLGN
ncbi:MAG TPA: hypothetical protein VM866_02025 [Pyrinomonadaceae bacterium]|nr:hypothetical protein [Pyrinomonadaceae bacterium]